MISLFQSASEKDVEKFASRLRDGLNSKFSFVIGQSKLLHLLAELNGFKNWQSFKIGLSRNIPQFVLDFCLASDELDPECILDAEELGGVVYLAFRDSSDSVHAGVLYPRGEDWYKLYWDIEEPFAEECPARILALLSKTDDEGALRWRERCRIRASREGEFDTEELPYRQLFHLAFPIEVNGVKVRHFVRSSKDAFEGVDGDCKRVEFGFSDFGPPANIGFTTIPEFRNNTQAIQEVIGDPLMSGLRLFSIGGDQPVDILVERNNRIVSWCGYSDALRDHYGAHADGGLFDRTADSRGEQR